MPKARTKTKPTEISVDDFLGAVHDPQRRADAEEVEAMLRRVSGVEPKMWGPSIIGYGQYHYRYGSGHEGDAPRLAFSPRKTELVLYLLENAEQEPAEQADLLARLGKYRRGKSCLYVKRLSAIDMEILEQLARRSWQRIGERYPA